MPDLLICIEGSASDDDAARCRDLFDSLGASTWTYQPIVIDQLDAMPVSDAADLPAIRTVGVAIALPEAQANADEEAVRRDVSRLVEAASRAAATHHLEFVVEYAQEEIGYLDGSTTDGRVVAAFFGDA